MWRMAKPKTEPPVKMGRPTDLEGPWADMCDAAGGFIKLAELLGTTKMTLWRWTRGAVNIPGPARVAIEAVAFKLGVKNPLEGV
jgi:hypothetical protein